MSLVVMLMFMLMVMIIPLFHHVYVYTYLFIFILINIYISAHIVSPPFTAKASIFLRNSALYMDILMFSGTENCCLIPVLKEWSVNGGKKFSCTGVNNSVNASLFIHILSNKQIWIYA
jgi:hypothetical protein